MAATDQRIAELEDQVKQHQATIRSLSQDNTVYIGFWHQDQQNYRRTQEQLATVQEELALRDADYVNKTAQLAALQEREQALRKAAIAFVNEAPLEGDYALLLASLTSTVTDKQRQMVTTYAERRKALYELLKTPAKLGTDTESQK